MATEVDLTGHYDLVYSPDDEAKTGKGYWVDLFKTREKAVLWAARNGGRFAHCFEEF